MNKTLSHILTVFKVASIVAKVAFILCIVGGVGCLVGLITLPMVKAIQSIPALAEAGLNLPSAYLGCIVGAIGCAGGAVFMFLAERYFKNVLSAGTPFTKEGATESLHLGIASIIISVATSLAACIAVFVVELIASPALAEADVNISVSLSTGLFFLFLSLIFKHGAELQEKAEQSDSEAQ